MNKRVGIYAITILCTLYSIFFVIPKLQLNLDSLELTTKTLKDIEIKSYKYTPSILLDRGGGGGTGKGFRNREEMGTIVIYKMTDNTEYEITGYLSKYTGIILSRENIGKTIKIYTEEEGTITLQLEIDNKVIYGIKETNQYLCAILAFVLGLIIYSIVIWRKTMKE